MMQLSFRKNIPSACQKQNFVLRHVDIGILYEPIYQRAFHDESFDEIF